MMKINIENLIEVPEKNSHNLKCTGCVFNFAGSDCYLQEILPCADNGTIFVEKPPNKTGIEYLIKVPELKEGSCIGCEFEDGEGCSADNNHLDADCADTNKIFISKNRLDEYNMLVTMLNENSMLKRFVEEKITEVIQ